VTKKRATRKTAPKEAQQRAAELSELIRQANALYYGGGQSTLSDAEFDALYLELQQLEARYPALQQRKSSPTQRPGAPAMAKAPAAEGEAPAAKKRSAKKKASKDSELGGATTAVPVPHRLPMLSLDSTTSFDKLLAWDASLRKKVAALTGAKAAAGASKTKSTLPPLPYTLELKYDGIAVSLLYRKNSSGEVRLERVLTRGSGTVGEDVSRAVARWVRGVPQTLTVDWMRGAEEASLSRFVAEDGALIEVRGEVLLSKSSQASYADFLARYGGEKARAADVGRTPARNLAAGLLRRDVVAEEAAASSGEEALDAQGRPAPACLDLVTYSLHFHHPDVRHVTPYLQDPPGTRTVQVGMEHPVPATQSEALEMLRRLGMPTAMRRILAQEHGADIGSDNGVVAQFATVHACGDIDRVIDELSLLAERRKSLDFAIDGAVVKLADLGASAQLGATNHHPKAQLAFKFAPKRCTTRLLGIEWSVGRTPKLTPVALLAPVLLDGVRVARANMHNASVVGEMLPLNIGDRVEIERRGDVIPHVVGKAPPIASQPDSEELSPAEQEAQDALAVPNEGDALELPTHCPCPRRSPLVLRVSASDPSRSDLLCAAAAGDVEAVDGEDATSSGTPVVGDSACPAQAAMQMEYYASKGVLDLSGLGEATLASLRGAGFLQGGVADLVRLPRQREELRQAAEAKLLPKMTPARVDKLLDMLVQRHRAASDAQLLLALGIPRLGAAQAKALLESFGDLRSVLAADFAALEAARVPGLGDKLLEAFAVAFEQARHGELVRAWEEEGVLPAEGKREPRPVVEVAQRTAAASLSPSRSEAKTAKAAAAAVARAARVEARAQREAEKAAAKAARLEAKAARDADKTIKKRAPRTPRAAKAAPAEIGDGEEDASQLPTPSQPLLGMRVCVVGRLVSGKRSELVSAVRSLGGVVQSVCSRSTTHLLMAAEQKPLADDKAQQVAMRAEAVQRGVPTLDEQAFARLLANAANQAAEAEAQAEKEAALEAANEER